MDFHPNPQNLKLIHYFLPQKLEKASIVSAFISKTKKKEIDLEFDPFHLHSSISANSLLAFKENQFSFYNKNPFFEGSRYSFSFRSVDFFNKELKFSTLPKKSQHLISFSHLYNTREILLKELKEAKLVKSRFVSTKKKASSFNFFASRAIVKNNFSRYSKKVFFKSTLVELSQSLGFLKNCKVGTWKVSRQPSRKSSSKRATFYFSKNRKFRSFFILQKAKVGKKFTCQI